jgi:hypothetical protein
VRACRHSAFLLAAWLGFPHFRLDGGTSGGPASEACSSVSPRYVIGAVCRHLICSPSVLILLASKSDQTLNDPHDLEFSMLKDPGYLSSAVLTEHRDVAISAGRIHSTSKGKDQPKPYVTELRGMNYQHLAGDVEILCCRRWAEASYVRSIYT